MPSLAKLCHWGCIARHVSDICHILAILFRYLSARVGSPPSPLLSHTHYRSPAQFAFHSHLSADADRDNLLATAYASLGELIGRTPRECAPIVVATLPSIVQRMRIAHQARSCAMTTAPRNSHDTTIMPAPEIATIMAAPRNSRDFQIIAQFPRRASRQVECLQCVHQEQCYSAVSKYFA